MAPPRVSVLAPALVKLKAPPIASLIVTALAVVSVVLPVSVALPVLKVSAPLLVASPSVMLPLKLRAFVSVRSPAPLVLSERKVVPVLNVSVPVPTAALDPSASVPALTVVPPL